MAEKNSENTFKFKIRYVFFGIILFLLLLALFSHHAEDLAVLDGGSTSLIRNLSGPAGAWAAKVLFYFFGIAAYPVTIFLMLCIIRTFLPGKTKRRGYLSAVCSVILGITILFALWPADMVKITDKLGIGRKARPTLALSGGVIGSVIAAPESAFRTPSGEIVKLEGGFLRRFIGPVGTLIAALALLLIGLVFIFIADYWGYISPNLNFKISIARKEDETKDPGKEKEEESPDGDGGIALRNDKPKKIEPHRPDTELPEEKTAEALPTENPAPEEDDGKPPFDPDEGIPLHKEEKKEQLPPKNDAVQPVRITNGMNGSTAASPLSEAMKGSGSSSELSGSEEKYVFPNINHFEKHNDEKNEDPEYLHWTQEHLQATLDSFGIAGRVSNIVVGPRVTRFEISLDPGVKVEKISSIANNIAMEIKAESIRILAPIPGQDSVGVEVPNRVSSNVYIRSIMEGDDWQHAKVGAGNIPIILGRDVSGRSVIANLAKAPHLLIAGSTGSGKSVCMNTLIMSLLCKFSPYDLRLILVDPKFVELAMYKPLPHLITPVVNDPKLVPLALRWGVNEMEKRYQILAAVKAKNLESFNSRRIPDEPELMENGELIPKKLPLLVIIVDELADIMMTDAKADVETSICRIAQKGRAAGIHLVIATQTPRKDVITGLIKANLPTKIAFRVGSNIDSRVILDKSGAEKLLGKGDMLFMPPGGDSLERVQGSMVADPEIQKVVDFVSAQVSQHFNSDVVAEAEIQDGSDDEGHGRRSTDEDDFGEDALPPGAADSIAAKYLKPGDSDLMRQALEIILEERKASTSYIQRRLGIGYNKSAELMDLLEKRGIISAPLPGGQKRDILILDELIETNEL